jgi:hypothetical protein
MNEDDQILKAWHEAQAALAEAEQDSSEEGRARQIFIQNCLADFSYHLHDVLKAQGRESEANQAHRKGNEYWSKVVAMVGDRPPPPKKNSDALTVREAADRLDAMRLSKPPST